MEGIITFLYFLHILCEEPDDEQESTNDGSSGFEKPIGHNYWNQAKSAWEPFGHGVGYECDDHRFFMLVRDQFPVCYRYCDDDGKFHSKHPGLPVFEEDYLKETHCLQPFFSEWGVSSDSFVFIMFTSDELGAAGIEVPDDHTGYRIDPFSASFSFSPRPEGHGWDHILRKWVPICTTKHFNGCMCTSGNLSFDWHEHGHYMTGHFPIVVCSFEKRTVDEARHTCDNPLRGLFSNRGGPYCSVGCYCAGCNKFFPPEEAQKHEVSKSGRSRNCDRFFDPDS
jgi:hypothetical protein